MEGADAKGYTALREEVRLEELVAATASVIKRLTGADMQATRRFLLKQCFVPGQGFSSQYAGQTTVSCATTAICMYALSEMGLLKLQERSEFRRVLLRFRLTAPAERTGAFPRTTAGAPSVWTTGQAVLALLSLGASWADVESSVEWLLRTQAANGGWNFPGTAAGQERLIYTFYPTLVVARCRRRLGNRAKQALSHVAAFIDSCEEHETAFWAPLREHMRRVAGASRRNASSTAVSSLMGYGELFEDGWPTTHVDENWLSERFSMSLMCGPNYLHLRRVVRADDPLALLHIRYLADERINGGWNDKHEPQPKTWATALGALTLYRWAADLIRIRANPSRLPTRAELIAKLRGGAGAPRPISKTARGLLRRLSTLHPGALQAMDYQVWVRDVFTFLFGEVLKEPKLESKTFFGTLRRDVTFRNAAQTGPWFDWKIRHETDPLLIECKNKEVLSFGDLRQTASYLGKRMGRLAILTCRTMTADDIREILNWFVNNDEKYVLVLNDDALVDWVRLKDRGEDPTDAIADLYRSLREGAQ